MRRALYLGGIFLATGAAIALATPAQAGGHPCPEYAVAGYQSVGYIPGGYGYGDEYNEYNDYSSYNSIEQNGLLNVGLIDSPISIL